MVAVIVRFYLTDRWEQLENRSLLIQAQTLQFTQHTHIHRQLSHLSPHGIAQATVCHHLDSHLHTHHLFQEITQMPLSMEEVNIAAATVRGTESNS